MLSSDWPSAPDDFSCLYHLITFQDIDLIYSYRPLGRRITLTSSCGGMTRRERIARNARVQMAQRGHPASFRLLCRAPWYDDTRKTSIPRLKRFLSAEGQNASDSTREANYLLFPTRRAPAAEATLKWPGIKRRERTISSSVTW